MFDRMLETTGPGRPSSYSPLAVSIALTGHLAAALGILGGSYLILEQVRDPDPGPTVFLRGLSIVFDRVERPSPRRGGGPPGKGGHAVASTPTRPRELPRPRIDAAPEVPPEEPPLEPARDELDALTPDFEGDLSGYGPPGTGPDGPGGGNKGGLGPPGGGDGPVGDSVPLVVKGDVEPPVLLHKVEPEYPEIARRARMTGRVFLRAVIGVSGEVEAVEILSATSPLFEAASVAAVKKWTYRPARYHGAPVAVYFTVSVSFTLR